MSQTPANPAISVIIATHNRPELLAKALQAVLDQDYAGPVECVLVFDQAEPDHALAINAGGEPARTVIVTANTRTPGLAGARNHGAETASGELLAFCDDDDLWLPAKLRLQAALLRERGAEVVTSGIIVDYGGRQIPRVPTEADMTVAELVRRRVMEAHPSTVVVRHEAFFGAIGPVDEEIPGSFAEDYDWMLRAAAAGPIAVVPQPLVTVLWGRTSHFNRKWRTISEALRYLVHKHPEFHEHPSGLARVYGQIAFAHAALGEGAKARSWARSSLSLSVRERRAYLAVLVSLRLIKADRVLQLAHRSGRGI